MRQIVKWIRIIALTIACVDCLIMGVKLIDNDFNVLIEAHIVFACLLIQLFCTVYQLLGNKCPYCGRWREMNGAFCPHCGRKIPSSSK